MKYRSLVINTINHWAFSLALCLATVGCDEGRGSSRSADATTTPVAASTRPTTGMAAGLAASRPTTQVAEDETSEPAALVPTPDVALQINARTELTVYQGTPLVVTVRLANQRAGNVQFANAAETRPANRLAVPVVQFGQAWAKSIRLDIYLGEKSIMLPLAPISPPQTQPVALDGLNNVQAQWGLSPVDAAKLAPGVYRITAVLEAAPGAAPGWGGRVESEPVSLTIKPRPANLQGRDALEADLDLARYWTEAGDAGKSLAAARKAVADDPKSIDAYVTIGDALSTNNDVNGALAAYRTALGLYNQQQEGKTDPEPEYLYRQIRRLLRQKEAAARGNLATPP